MEESKDRMAKIVIPPLGYVVELARLCGCSRQTVHSALRKKSDGEKARLVRRMYLAKYVNKEISSEV